MNERIEQLMLEAGSTGNKQVWFTRKEVEKFAELIIKDCLKIVEQRTNGPYDIAMTKETRNAWNTWIEIKEHFGVKCDF